ncbi:MAG: radical SAM protein [Acidobacteriota bacterium]|nr:radical SAM protein [Blastocatellia bacterium]MDW8239469.1 radical SAM protein [Acidobacteriota bacterium]
MNSLTNRIRIARDYLGRRALCDGMPIEFSIELTSRCNLKCIMCPRDDNAERGLGNMKMETFQRIIDQASQYLEFTYLHLAGEPLMHPQFGEFIEYAASKGIQTGISTNGTILDRRRAEILINSKLADLIISIDGEDRETYRRIRGADSFRKVVENAETFLQMKRAAGRGPYTVMQMIVMNENAHQAKQFYRHWKQLGADAVRLKRFFNFAGNVEDRSVNQPKLVQLTNGNGNGTGQSASSTGQGNGTGQSASSAGNGNGTGVKKKIVLQAESGRRQPCFLLWRQMAFYYDGTAVSCCHDFLHESVLGNIHQQTLEEIWNSPVMVDMRRKHLEGRQHEIPLCAGCNQPTVSVPEVLGATLLNASVTKKALIAVERMARLAGIQTPY